MFVMPSWSGEQRFVVAGQFSALVLPVRVRCSLERALYDSSSPAALPELSRPGRSHPFGEFSNVNSTHAAATWPSALRPQQPMPIIGFLHTASPATIAERMPGFSKGLTEAGYIDGQNVTIDTPPRRKPQRPSGSADRRPGSPECGRHCHAN